MNIDVTDIEVTTGQLSFKINIDTLSYAKRSGLYVVTCDYNNTKIYSSAFILCYNSSAQKIYSSANLNATNFSVETDGTCALTSESIEETDQFEVKCCAIVPFL